MAKQHGRAGWRGAYTVVGGFALLLTAIGISCLSLNSGASSTPFDYADFPASATVNQSCSASNLSTVSISIGSWTGTNLADAPTLAPGASVTWVFTNNDAHCTQDVATLALYASDGVTFDGNSDQASVASDSANVPAVGQARTIELYVPAGFAGPYQLDAVFGQELPIVGPDGNWYGGIVRSVQSDDREMLVTSAKGTIGALTSWPNIASQSFDYANYPTDQFADQANPCATSEITDESGSGNTQNFDYTINGTYLGPDNSGQATFVLHTDDVVDYTFEASGSCVGQKICIALYRNPDGGQGLYHPTVNQLLEASGCTVATAGVNTVQLTVPTIWDGGYQLDVVIGDPLPVVGDAGGLYGTAVSPTQGVLISTDFNIMRTTADPMPARETAPAPSLDPVDFALATNGAIATQSTTWANGSSSAAAFAINGTPGINDDHSNIAATLSQTNPWWQVDLGASHALSEIVVDNRTDCCLQRLTGYGVFVTDAPLDVDDQSTLTSLQAEQQQSDPSGASIFEPTQASPSTPISLPANTNGRYVTVVLFGSNQTLNLAGVSAIGPA